MCQTCNDDPTSHSFMYVGKTNEGYNILYTCPAKATKYWDTSGILQHYNEVLDENQGQTWVWLFDGQDFGLAHSMQISTAIGLVHILTENNHSLSKIQIVNPTIYIHTLYGFLLPFLSNELVEKIQWA